MIEMLLTMALTGTAVSLLWLAVCRLMGARLSAPWRYRGLRLTLVFWLVPVERCLRALGGVLRAEPAVNVPAVLPETFYRPVAPAEPVSAVPEVWSISQGAAALLLAAWGLGAICLLTKRFAAYRRFRKRLERQGGPEPDGRTRLLLLSCQQQVGVTGSIRLRIRTAAPTPFVMGLLRPVVVLPEQEFTRNELRCILLHELTHVKQGDQWTRRAALLVTALHWWNPAAHWVERTLTELSEESCDARTAAAMDHQERYEYGLVLLKTACSMPVPTGAVLPLSTTENVQRRLSKMLRVKQLTPRQKILSLATVALLLAGGIATALAVRSPVTVEEPPETATPLSGVEMEQGTPSTPISDTTPVTLVEPVTDVPDVSEPEPVSEPDTGSADTPETKQPATPASTPEPVQTATTQPETGATEPERTIEAQYWVQPKDGSTDYYTTPEAVAANTKKDDGETYLLLYTDYSDGTREYSPYYQQKLDEARTELIAKGVLDENGQYFKNSKGETYCVNPGGLYGPAAILGEESVYEAAQGTRGERGYIRTSDDNVRVPMDPAECPHVWELPLYDQEGNEIGVYEITCGGHRDFSGMTVEEAKAALAEATDQAAAQTIAAREARAKNQ